MPRFSALSQSRLDQCDRRLHILFNEVVIDFDCSILEGHRDQETQDRYYHTGKSKLAWPHSKHNSRPSLAVDAAPYPIDWDDTERFYFFGGFVLATAKKLHIPIRWGGDWSGNTQIKDERFKDLCHFEIMEV